MQSVISSQMNYMQNDNVRRSIMFDDNNNGTNRRFSTLQNNNNNSNNIRSSIANMKDAMLRSKQETQNLQRDPDHVTKKTVTEKSKRIRRYRRLLKINDTIAAVCGIFGLCLAILEYESFYDDTDKCHFCPTTLGTILRSVVSISTGVEVVLVVFHSIIAMYLNVEKGVIEVGTNYFSTKQFKQCIAEVIVLGIHCPPGMDNTYVIKQLDQTMVYSLPGIIMVWMLLRFYLVFRLFAQYSKWTNELAEECCEPEGCEANTLFAMKAVLKEKPHTSLLMLMIISTIIFGLAVRHFERPVYMEYSQDDPNFQDYSYIWNGMWLIMITMMTVGYGDFFPRTHMGRFVCILACFWGVFLVSMMVVTLTVSSSFDPKESRAYDILFRLNIKNEIKKKAEKVVGAVMRCGHLEIRRSKNMIQMEPYKKQKILLRNKLEIALQIFRDTKAQLPDYEISSEELLRQLTEKIDRDLDEVKDILISLIDVENQLNEIEQSQDIVLSALNESINYTNLIENNLSAFKSTIMEKYEKSKSEQS